MNLVFSGWPGAGTTTLATITAHLLSYKYLYAGGVFKHIAQLKVGETSGEKYLQFEREFGPVWDEVWEKYALWKLENSDHLVLEAKTAGVKVDNGNVLEVFVVASLPVRIQRAQSDKRIDAKDTITNRDQILQARWKESFGFDIYDLDVITQVYDLVIDNSRMGVREEVNRVLDLFSQQPGANSSLVSKARLQVEDVLAHYELQGKAFVVSQLREQNLYIEPVSVLKEMQQFATKGFNDIITQQ